MPTKFFFLSAAALACSAASYAQSVAPPQPVQTISLKAQEALSAVVRLPNQQSVLFVTTLGSPTVHLMALDATGRTAWDATVTRYQQSLAPKESPVAYLRPWEAATEAYWRAVTPTLLEPLSVLTDGDDVYTAEWHPASGAKQAPELLTVHRVAARGTTTQASFSPEAVPTEKGLQVYTVGRFAEGGAYVEIVREDREKGRNKTFFLRRYDLATKAVTRSPLTLPATPEPTPRVYNDWAFLGHRPNQTYLFRRVASRGKQSFGSFPLEYQVLVLDGAGRETGGFITTLELSKGTGPTFSAGLMPSLQEQAHVPHSFEAYHHAGTSEVYTESIDDWNVSTGIFGDFYLDYATGDVLVFGEYGPYALPSLGRNPKRQGSFVLRFGADGQLRQRAQHAYGKEELNAHETVNEGFWQNRRAHFLYDPFTQSVTLGFSGDGGRLNEYFDPQLNYRKFEVLPTKTLQKEKVTYVQYAGPAWVSKPRQGTRPISRTYIHHDPAGPALYGQLEALRRAAGDKPEYYQLYLTPLSERSALAVERTRLQGGVVRVYALAP